MASSLPADCDRAWDGLVYYKKGTFVSRYEPYWGVVRRESSRGLQRIDLFRPLSPVYSTSDLFVPLHDVLHVLNRDARAKKFAFQILATGCKYHLAAESAEDRERWVQGLKRLLFGPPQLGVVYEHQVMIIPNSHSEKLQLSGRYILRITDSHIALFTSTGTLPTRFLYSLSDIARTRYTTFTDAGHKFSVLVLYCHGYEATDCQPVQQVHNNSSSNAVSLGNGGLVGEEGMFVFQTQSASLMSRTIEHRAKEIARREGQSKKTRPCSTRGPASNWPPMSLPSASSSQLNEEIPENSGNESPKKPHPPPKPTRASVSGSPAHSPVHLSNSIQAEYTDPVKPKKAPIPLPRHKKYSLDSNTQHSVLTAANGPPPTAKPRRYPHSQPKLDGLSSLGDLESPGLLVCQDSITSCSSLPNPDLETPATDNFMAESDSPLTSPNDAIKTEPTYVNFTSLTTIKEREARREGKEREKETAVVGEGRGEKETEGKEREESDAVGARRVKNEMEEEVVAVGAERGEKKTSSEQDSSCVNKETSHVSYYNPPPSKSHDEMATVGNIQTATLQEKCDNLSPSNSCNALLSPADRDDSGISTQKGQQQLQETKQEVASTTEESEDESLPSLDEFLAKILQRRRESKDINEGCDNESNENNQNARFSLNRTRSNDARLMVQAGISHVHAGSPQTPHYYNLPPLVRSKGLTVDEEDEQEDNSADRDSSEEKTKVKISGSDSLTEKEYRSDWLRRGGSLQDWMHTTRTEARDSGEDEDPYNMYLKILPSTAQSLPHPSRQPVGMANIPDSECKPTSPVPEEPHRNSTPESGSPLWGTHQACSRQDSVPSPLTQREALHSPPFSSTVQDPSKVDGEKTGSTVVRKKKRLGSHRRQQKQGTLSRRRRRLSTKENIEYNWPSHRRSSSKRKTAVRTGPLPSLPQNSVEVDSDYEWAEIEEALSDTGSDYIYTSPLDLGIDFNPRRSASCSELAPSIPEYLSISERPPAPLPTLFYDEKLQFFPDPVIKQNPAHIETPTSTPSKTLDEKRSTFQRSHSVGNYMSASGIYEDVESQVDYEYIEESDGDYDYAAIPNRNAANLFLRGRGEYVDINRNSHSHTPSSSSSSSSSSPTHRALYSKGPALPPRQRPRPPPRPLMSLPATDV